ncbi:MAG: TrkH family potassium uptake protein [Chlamydiales bacterium]|nr:TrkH family potassium uptake protein [Chlamydiales bacterium]
MVWKPIFKTLEFYLYILASILVIPLIVSFYYQFIIDPTNHPQPFDTFAFFLTILVCLCCSLGFRILGKGSTNVNFYRRDGILVVVLIWLITPAISTLPFLFNNTLEHFEDAYFEMCSGYTTTGMSILCPKAYDTENKEVAFHISFAGLWKNETKYDYYGTIKPVLSHSGDVLYEGIEAIGKGLLFWRSLTQWLGGIGIILLFVAVIPVLEAGAKVLFQSELVGPIKEDITPRTQNAALSIFKIYLAMTLLQIIMLVTTNSKLSFFDAVNIALTTVSSGGFSVKNGSIASYQNAATEWVIVVFMILGTINFSLFYYLLKRKFYRLKDPELITYLALIIIFATITSWKLLQNLPFSLEESIRYGTFQIISTLSTTGFSIADYNYWPASVQVLMLISMYIGGMSGSTAGGIKVIRYYLLSRLAINRIETVFRPERVRIFNYGDKRINLELSSNVLCFFFIYISIAVLATIIYVFNGIDPETALGLSSCILNTVGTGFGMAGPEYSCAFLTSFGKYFSCLLMFLGRLELFIILILFIPAFWRRK